MCPSPSTTNSTHFGTLASSAHAIIVGVKGPVSSEFCERDVGESELEPEEVTFELEPGEAASELCLGNIASEFEPGDAAAPTACPYSPLPDHEIGATSSTWQLDNERHRHSLSSFWTTNN